jgi:acyl-CoA thioester hydrolase
MAFSVSMDIRFADIDKMGHVNNAKYLTYFEQARMYYLQKVIGKKLEWSREGIILAKVEIDFIAPILLNDTIQIEVNCTRLGNKSFDLEYTINKLSSENKIMAAKGKTVMVCYNYQTDKTISIPESWRNELIDFENL